MTRRPFLLATATAAFAVLLAAAPLAQAHVSVHPNVLMESPFPRKWNADRAPDRDIWFFVMTGGPAAAEDHLILVLV